MIEVAFFFVAKTLAVTDEKLKVACVRAVTGFLDA
jgi:hypothetical protein